MAIAEFYLQHLQRGPHVYERGRCIYCLPARTGLAEAGRPIEEVMTVDLSMTQAEPKEGEGEEAEQGETSVDLD